MTWVQRVLGIDPGKMTGIALLERNVNTNEVTNRLTAELEILGENREHATLMRNLIQTWPGVTDGGSEGHYPMRIVVERFTITPDTGKKSQEAKAALETIGAVKLICVEAGYPLDAITWQSPAEAKMAWPNPKLRRLDLWHRGGAGHAMDALRHAALYLVTNGWSDPRMIN